MDARTRPLIVTLGDLIVDVVAAAAGPLAYGSDRAGSVALRQGGSAANTARWIVASGGQAVFIGAVGRDEWARRLAASLTRASVAVHMVGKAAPTARIVAIVEPGGERTFVTDRGAADLLVASDLRPRWFAGAVGLHLPAYSLYNRPLASAALRAVQLARAAGAMVSVDLASRQPILDLGPGEAWSRIASVTPDVLFANASEAEAILEGRTERALLDLAAIVVVKRGGTGCRVLARPVSPRATSSPADVGRASLVLDVPAAAVQVRDTTGAGDAFAAGFLVRLLAREPGTRHTRRALSSASKAGHRTATRLLRGTHRADTLS